MFGLLSSPSVIQILLFQWSEGTGRPTSTPLKKKKLLSDPHFLCNDANTFTISSAFKAMWVVWPIRKMTQMVNVGLNLSVTVIVPSRTPLRIKFIWIVLMAKLSLAEICKWKNPVLPSPFHTKIRTVSNYFFQFSVSRNYFFLVRVSWEVFWDCCTFKWNL